MKALIIQSYQSNLVRAMQGISLVDIETPAIEEDEVLIRVEMAPINPSDIAFLRGGYNIKRALPAIPGFEGCGLIVKKGDALQYDLIGQRVSFFAQGKSGTWAEYVAVKYSNCIAVHPNISVEQAASLFVNPFTTLGLFNHVLANEHQAIIQSAAKGQVGEFIRFFARKNNLPLINLVRKDTHVEELKNNGEYVLNINDENFYENLQKAVNDLTPTIAIDAIGGELTGKLLNVMPKGSEVVLYGGLSGNTISQIDPMELIFNNKILSGFNLGDLLNDLTSEEVSEISKKIQELFLNNHLKTRIQKIVPIENHYDGLRSYISNMSAGKVLLKC